MTTKLEHNQEIGKRRETVAMMITKMDEEGIWDSLKAKDVPDEIVQHVLSEIELGKDPAQVRRAMGIRSQTSKQWQKISAAIKQGYRVNTTTFFHKLFTRSERMGDKLFKILDTVLDQDIDKLKETDEDGMPFMRIFAKEVTPMIDAYNRLQQGIVKIGKDVGVFADPANENKGGGGVTIVVKSHINLPNAEDMVKAKAQKANTIEGTVVSKKELP